MTPRLSRVSCGGALLLASFVVSATCAGQATGPVLLLQPGMASADFISAPDGDPSTTGFNLRFATIVYTGSRWITPIIGASVTPYGSSGATRRNTNTPTLFAGNVFPVLPSRRTNGWLTLELPVLLTYTFGGGGTRNPRIYGRDFVVQGAFTVHAGPKLLGDFGGPLSRLRVYALLEQNLTPNRRRPELPIDRFNPMAFYGISIPIGTSRQP
jgi:hypothetical protein